jgi:hypothetical protein
LSIWALDRPEDWVVGLVNEVQTRAEVEALRGQRHAWAYHRLFGESPRKWSQAYAKKVFTLAKKTPIAELLTLGNVGLDSFIVSSKTGLPGEGHWKTSAYDREEWERVLGTATLLRS